MPKIRRPDTASPARRANRTRENLTLKVSFISPLFNCLALTKEMVVSLQKHLPAGLDHEIILVDDGSTDGTRDWLKTLAAPFRVVLNERNLGYAGANNRGGSAASGDLLVLLNNDLVLTQDWLDPMIRAYRGLGSRAGVVGNVQRRVADGVVDHSGVIINLKAKPEHKTALPPRWMRLLAPTRRVDAVTGACALVDRALWNSLGGFDEGYFNGGEDVDFCFRAAGRGKINVVAVRSIIFHHISASPGRKLRDEQNSYRLAKKWRDTLEDRARRSWCWDYLQQYWTSPHPSADHASARAALLYGLHLRRSPPVIAVEGMHEAMAHELARWERLLQ
ncbi:MAG: glycosyltransferase [Opitutus sp.]